MSIELIILTFAPSIIIALYIIYSDKFKEPIFPIIQIFFLGFLLALPAGYLNKIIIFQQHLSASWAGLTEESLKYFILFFYVRRKDFFNEPMDAIVYGVLISLGFASIENYSYIYTALNNDNNEFYLAILRGLTTIPMHALCGVVMGYFFGCANFIERKNNLAKALFIPMAIHATFNYFAENGHILLTIIFLVIVLKYAKSLHNTFKALQENKTIEYEDKIY